MLSEPCSARAALLVSAVLFSHSSGCSAGAELHLKLPHKCKLCISLFLFQDQDLHSLLTLKLSPWCLCLLCGQLCSSWCSSSWAWTVRYETNPVPVLWQPPQHVEITPKQHHPDERLNPDFILYLRASTQIPILNLSCDAGDSSTIHCKGWFSLTPAFIISMEISLNFNGAD